MRNLYLSGWVPGGCISWKYNQLSQAKAEAKTEFGKNNISIAILLILPTFAHTDFSKFSKRSVQYWAKARFKLKIGVSLDHHERQSVLFFSKIVFLQISARPVFKVQDQDRPSKVSTSETETEEIQSQ